MKPAIKANGDLPDMLLTLQRGRNTFGYFAPSRFAGESVLSELAMNLDKRCCFAT